MRNTTCKTLLQKRYRRGHDSQTRLMGLAYLPTLTSFQPPSHYASPIIIVSGIRHAFEVRDTNEVTDG